GRINTRTQSAFETAINESVNDENFTYLLQPLTDAYFGPRVDGDEANHGDAYSIVILICITGLILFLSITGLVNLTTLTLPHRSKEMAVKKLAGMGQWSLAWTFL